MDPRDALCHVRVAVCVGNLVIHNVQRFDAGTYLCKAANGAGDQQAKVISVDVLGLYNYRVAKSELFAFSALTLLVGRQEGHPACKNME